MPVGSALPMKWSGYAPRVFSVRRSESRSSSRVERVDVDVLEDGAEPARRREDVRLVHRREADRLGVAAALEVEDVVAAPAVLVVADQAAQRVRGQGRLAGPREPEEDDRIAGLADVDRGVHREHALVGHQVVHDRERRLLDLAGVHRADDDDLHPLEVDQDRGPRADPLRGGVGLEGRHVDDREVRGEARQVVRGRPAEQVPGEDARPGGLGVHAERSAVGRMRPDEQVLAVQAPIGEVGHQPAAEPVVVLLADRVVHVAPPDVRLARRLADDELVLRRSAGVGPVATTSGPSAAIRPSPLADRRLVQGRGRQVRDDLAGPDAGAGAMRARTRRVGLGRGGHRSSVSCSGVPTRCGTPCFDPTGRA